MILTTYIEVIGCLDHNSWKAGFTESSLTSLHNHGIRRYSNILHRATPSRFKLALFEKNNIHMSLLLLSQGLFQQRSKPWHCWFPFHLISCFTPSKVISKGCDHAHLRWECWTLLLTFYRSRASPLHRHIWEKQAFGITYYIKSFTLD